MYFSAKPSRMNSPQTATSRLHVPHPCPVHLSRLSGCGEQLACHTCAKPVFDLREKPIAEVRRFVDERVALDGEVPCCIFTEAQASSQPTPSRRFALLMRMLTIASWLGFSVQPLSAQESEVNLNAPSDEEYAPPKPVVISRQVFPYISPEPAVELTPRQKRIKARREKRRKRRHRHVTGCPAF